jgi:hypothetical protein
MGSAKRCISLAAASRQSWIVCLWTISSRQSPKFRHHRLGTGLDDDVLDLTWEFKPARGGQDATGDKRGIAFGIACCLNRRRSRESLLSGIPRRKVHKCRLGQEDHSITSCGKTTCGVALMHRSRRPAPLPWTCPRPLAVILSVWGDLPCTGHMEQEDQAQIVVGRKSRWWCVAMILHEIVIPLQRAVHPLGRFLFDPLLQYMREEQKRPFKGTLMFTDGR